MKITRETYLKRLFWIKWNKMISMFKKIIAVVLLIFTATALSIRKDYSHLRINSPKHQAYKDNLLVQNWYYGNIDPVDYRIRIFEIEAN